MPKRRLALVGALFLAGCTNSTMVVSSPDEAAASLGEESVGMAGDFRAARDTQALQEPLDLSATIAPNPDPYPESAASSPVDVSRYPAIGIKEMGQLRWVLELGRSPANDFSAYRSRNQSDLTAYRYSIAFAAYFLALEQYHKVPAWTEAIQPAFERHIERLLEKPVWDYWARTSRGVRTLEPDLGESYPEARDPVAEKNIMYSGHVGHVINLYEMLYRDFRWDAPGSIVYSWGQAESYLYDNHSLEQVMYQQMKSNAYRSVCCEPNAVFPECNQHPVLSFMLYDATHGTNLSEVNEDFFQFFKSAELIDPVTHETAMLYLVKQGTTLSQTNPWYHNVLDLAVGPAVKAGLVTLESSTANGWTGLFMHAWKPAYIEAEYPFWVKRHVIDKGNGVAELKWENWEPLVQVGFFAALAAEMGDTATRDKLLNYADRKYRPEWAGGTFHYPYNLRRGATDLTDRTLAMARALPKDGMLTLHTKPFAASHFDEPAVRKVDFPKVALTRAVYDASKEALVMTVVAGSQLFGSTQLEVYRLDPNRRYEVYVDGKMVRTLSGTSSATLALNVLVGMPRDVVVLAK